MILKNGKFYEGDKVVPLEFGNLEQIKLIKLENERLEDLKKGIPVDVDFDQKVISKIEFKCECNSTVYFENEGADEDEAAEELVGMASTCYRCKQKYEIIKDEVGDFRAIKKK